MRRTMWRMIFWRGDDVGDDVDDVEDVTGHVGDDAGHVGDDAGHVWGDVWLSLLATGGGTFKTTA